MNSSKPENTCNICQKTFTRRADCTRHARLHAGIRPYRCEVEGCGKRFAQFTALKTHSNVHTGLKPFKCGFAGCRSTFGDPSSCTRHRKEMHCPRKPYECFYPGCKSTILRSSAFKAHLKRHGDKYVEMFKRKETFAKVGRSTRIEEEQTTVQGSSAAPMNMLPSLSDAWGFLSFPEDASVSMGLQGGLSPGPSRSSPLVLSPCPQVAPSDTGYFLSQPRASPHISSQYSSPMVPTPDLSPMYPPLDPTMGFDFTGSVGARLSPCLATQDWTQVSWQDDGTQFI